MIKPPCAVCCNQCCKFLPVSDRLGSLLDRLLEGPTKLRYESAGQVLKDLDLALGRRSDVQSEETDQWQREQIDHQIDEPADPWHQVDEARSNELDASFEQSGEVAAVGKRGERRNVARLFKIISLLTGGTVMLSILLAWVQSSIIVEPPVVVQPPIGNYPPTPQAPQVRDLPSIPISKIIKPAYLRPVKPFKTVKNIPSFQAMALQDGGNTIVTGSIQNSELKLNFVNALSGEGRTGYTSSIIQLNSPLFKEANHTFLITEIYVEKENIFVYFWNNYSSSYANENLVKINIKDKSQFLPFLLPTKYEEGSDGISSISNGEFFNEFRDNYKSATNTIWKITDDGSLKKQKSFNDSFQSILSSDRKSIFRWIHSSSPYEVSILNLDKKIEQRISMPLDVTAPKMVLAGGKLFSVQRGGTEYLVIQGMNSFPDQVQDFSKISQTLPSFYQSKALEAAGRGLTHDGSVHVWDMTQKEFKYFLPREGSVPQIAIAPDGKTLAIGETRGDGPGPNRKNSYSRITVWDLPTGQLLREVNIDPVSVGLAFTSDSKTLITGAQKTYLDPKAKTQPTNAEISLWNVEELRNP